MRWGCLSGMPSVKAGDLASGCSLALAGGSTWLQLRDSAGLGLCLTGFPLETLASELQGTFTVPNLFN